MAMKKTYKINLNMDTINNIVNGLHDFKLED